MVEKDIVEQSESFGQWLRRRRKVLDLTQAGLGDLVGCSTAAIRKFEAEERRPSAQMAMRMREVFNIPVGEQEAFLRFARGDAGSLLLKSPHDEIPWGQPAYIPRGNLPSPPYPIIGREVELAEIRSYLLNRDIRLVTLIGSPGIGKTRLCLEAAHSLTADFLDGIFYVRLAPLDEPALILSTVMRSLGFHETEDRDVISQIRFGISAKHMLIVLDNCEHLIDHVALLTTELLSACPNLKIVATSREALRILGEWLYSVPVLGTPGANTPVRIDSIMDYPAIALFVERAQAVRSSFTLNEENLQAVTSICAQLDGLPLAIELLASRIRLMSPQKLLEQMSDQYILSVDGMRAVSARKKTINNAINWSYEFLSEGEKKIFAQLAVFSGGFTLEAAEEVCSILNDGRTISDIVISLFDKSLLQRRIDEPRGQRFYMLVTIKQFALQKLRLMKSEAETRSCHLDYFIGLAEMASEKIRGPGLVEWTDRLEDEHDNIRVALDWSITYQKTGSALRLLRAVGWSWEIHGHYSEAHCWLDRIETLPDIDDYSVLYAGLLNHIGRHSWSQGNIRDARALLQKSESICRKIGETGELTLAETLNWLGLVSLYGDRDSVKAKQQIEEGLTLFQKWDNRWGNALSRFHLGIMEISNKQFKASIELLEESLAEFNDLGDLFFIARVSSYLGEAFFAKGDLDKAKISLKKCLSIDQAIKFWNGITDDWCDLGRLHLFSEQYNQAFHCCEEAMAVCITHNLFKGDVFYWTGLLALMNNQYQQSYQCFRELLDTWIKIGEIGNLGSLLSGLAAVAASMDQWENAATLYGAASTSLELENRVLDSLESSVYNPFIQDVRTCLGDLHFESLLKKGQLMSLPEVHNLVGAIKAIQNPVP